VYRSWVRLRQDVLEEAMPLVHPERSRPHRALSMGHTQGGWEEQEQEQANHALHESARVSNTQTDSDVARETGEEEGPRERGCTGAHPTDGARLSRRWHTEGEQRAWDRSRRSRTNNICCPARHLRITLVVPCVKYRSWVRLRQDVLEEATPLVHPERSRPSSKNRASSRPSSGLGPA
jgi:hypothetical protein